MAIVLLYSENRKKEKNQLLNSLRNSINTFVFGPHGIGKTTLIKSVAEEYDSKFGQSVYVDCLLYQTANSILREALFSLGSVIASRSNYDLTKRLKEKTKRLKLVIFLDHFENLKNYEALNILLGLDFCVCLVSDTFESYRKMSFILRSRLTNVIRINEFSKDQILEIIKERVNSVYKFPMDDNLLQKIVEKSGSNLTFALNMLNTIASKAGRKNVRLIDYITFFEDVLDETSNEDHRIILEILRQSKRLPSGELYRLYCRRLEHPKSERSFRKYMQALCRQGLVKSIGKKKGREYEITKKKDSNRFCSDQ